MPSFIALETSSLKSLKNEDKMNYQKLKLIIAGLCGSAVIFSVVIYTIIFYDTPVSNNTQDWGAFGDYLGGILNPIIGIVNLVVLVYISVTIENTEERRHRNNLDSQRKMSLYTIKYDSLREVSNLLHKIQPEFVQSEEKSELKILLLNNELRAFVNRNSYLFENIDSSTNYQKLSESIKKLSIISGQYYISEYKLDEKSVLIPAINNFNELKDRFLNEIIEQILD